MSVEKVKTSLKQILGIDPQSLGSIQAGDRNYNCTAAISTLTKLQGLYRNIDESILSEIPDGWLQKIGNRLTSDLQCVSGENYNRTDFSCLSLEAQLRSAYQDTFNSVWQAMAYGHFHKLDTHSIKQQYESIVAKASETIANCQENFEAVIKGKHEEINKLKKEAEGILDRAKDVAATKGVLQQAAHFQTEVTKHEKAAQQWLIATRVLFGLLLLCAVAGLLIFDWFHPRNVYESIQLSLGKFLIIGVLTYATVLAARNFHSHKHNAEINQHRHNAVLTYQFFVDASKTPEQANTILTYVASCIYSPQDTGFVSGGSHGEVGTFKSVIEQVVKAPESK